ncbi:MAG: carboxypeptidase-like regulatory domain-containing protein [Saprospiraceae bacterium]|nr:carboxypeptidase-like regulatory domain-containing protein [Saprospiraceae bacterium]
MQGRIIEARGEPIAFANILLLTATDSAFVKGEISAVNGTFNFSQLSPGSCRCEVSMVGFATIQSAVFQLKD